MDNKFGCICHCQPRALVSTYFNSAFQLDGSTCQITDWQPVKEIPWWLGYEKIPHRIRFRNNTNILLTFTLVLPLTGEILLHWKLWIWIGILTSLTFTSRPSPSTSTIISSRIWPMRVLSTQILVASKHDALEAKFSTFRFGSRHFPAMLLKVLPCPGIRTC